MKTEVKKLESLNTINLVECEGAMCVSLGRHYNRYKALNMESKSLNLKQFKV